MSDFGNLSPAAELAATDPPRSFSSFALRPLPPTTNDYAPWVMFAVSCAACGCDDLRLGSYVEEVSVASPDAQAGSGEKLIHPPHNLKCERCGCVAAIFDARTDGYDGILNGGSPYESAKGKHRFTDVVCKVVLGATYNIELEELQELAANAGPTVKATDLFDWINIIATLPGGEPFELDYECA